MEDFSEEYKVDDAPSPLDSIGNGEMQEQYAG